MRRPKVVVIVDGPDPDNFICILAAIGALVCFDVIAVIMTGRPVSATASKAFAFNSHASRAVRRDNALHAKGILMRHGGEHVPVFEGLRAPFSTVPHHMHIHERVTDIYDDAHAGHVLAGNIDDAVVYLAEQEGMIHIICGGPLTDLAYLMRQPMLFGKLGIVTAQLGMFGFGNVTTIAGGRRQFNALADAGAARDVLLHYPSELCMIPTDVTKDPGHAFADPDDLATLGSSSALDEILAMYRAAWPIMWQPRGEKIFANDFHPVEVMDIILRRNTPVAAKGWFGRYTRSQVGIEHVPHLPVEMERWGEIDLGPINYLHPPRFLIDRCDTTKHRAILSAMLNTSTEQPTAQPA